MKTPVSDGGRTVVRDGEEGVVWVCGPMDVQLFWVKTVCLAGGGMAITSGGVWTVGVGAFVVRVQCASLQVSNVRSKIKIPDSQQCLHRGGIFVWDGTTQRSQGNEIPLCFTWNSEALPCVGELGTPKFFGHRLQTSTTRATVESKRE